MWAMLSGCGNLEDVPQFNINNVTNITQMFGVCNKLSDASIQNIINSFLNSNITNTTIKNLNNSNQYSPFYRTNITSSRYSNRLSELTAAGWSY